MTISALGYALIIFILGGSSWEIYSKGYLNNPAIASVLIFCLCIIFLFIFSDGEELKKMLNKKKL